MPEPATDELSLSTLNAGRNVFRCDLATDMNVWERIKRFASERHIERYNMCTALATQLNGAEHELQCDLLNRKVFADTSLLRDLQSNCRSESLRRTEPRCTCLNATSSGEFSRMD